MPIADLPQSNKMHAVPQNIMDVEFRLIGDLTMRQFVYLFVFGGVAYVSSVVMVGFFKWPLVLFFAVLGLGLAFVPIEERGLDEWIVNFVKSVYAPTQRIWRHEASLPSVFMYESLAVVKQELITLAPTSSRRRLEEYLEYQLPAKDVDPLDIPEREYMKKVRDAFADTSPAQGQSIAAGVIEPQVYIPASYPPSAGQEVSEPSSPQNEEPAKEESSISTMSTTQPISEPPTEPTSSVTIKAPELTATTQTTPVVAAKVEIPKPTQPLVTVSQPTQNVPTTHPTSPARTSETQASAQHDIHISKVQQKHQPKHKSSRFNQDNVALPPITPDRHAGRRFINLVPASGELVLPIRGERVLKTSQELEVEEDIQEKAERLQQLLSQIKQDTGQKFTTPVAPEKQQVQPARVEPQTVVTQGVLSPEIGSEAESLSSKLQKERERLTNEISQLEAQKKSAVSAEEVSDKDAKIKRLQIEKERTQADFEALQRQILELQNKLKEQSKSQPQVSATHTYASPAGGGAQIAPGRANIVTGVVKSKDGKVKDGTLLIIKNQKGEAVRAFKTDTLGHFKLSTPLSNGLYTIEVAANNTGEMFDIISFEVKGESIQPIEIIGK